MGVDNRTDFFLCILPDQVQQLFPALPCIQCVNQNNTGTRFNKNGVAVSQSQNKPYALCHFSYGLFIVLIRKVL